MITNIIRALYEGLSQSMLIYLKPSSKRIDNLKITIVINFLSFYNFDEKGNAKYAFFIMLKHCKVTFLSSILYTLFKKTLLVHKFRS